MKKRKQLPENTVKVVKWTYCGTKIVCNEVYLVTPHASKERNAKGS